MLGRAAALDTLRQFIDRDHQAQGQTILISGEAGIGKSRLVREAAALASGSGFLVLQAHCFQHERAGRTRPCSTSSTRTSQPCLPTT